MQRFGKCLVWESTGSFVCNYVSVCQKSLPCNSSLIIYMQIHATETWCLKAKMVAKLNSTEMDFWRRSARLDSPGRTKLGTLLLNKR